MAKKQRRFVPHLFLTATCAAEAVPSIVADGFRDATDFYMTDELHSGVWLADRPLDPNDGAYGDALLVVEIPDDVFAGYEWREEGKSIREALIPADVVNRYGPATVVSEGDDPPLPLPDDPSKPTFVLAPGDLTLDDVVELYKQLTGRDATPEELAEVQALLDSPDDE